uniref:Uncharacterized protein n=1 Tax=Arundo donax TaxID=35708 RepID=A0A0A8YQ88_ARUDO
MIASVPSVLAVDVLDAPLRLLCRLQSAEPPLQPLRRRTPTTIIPTGHRSTLTRRRPWAEHDVNGNLVVGGPGYIPMESMSPTLVAPPPPPDRTLTPPSPPCIYSTGFCTRHGWRSALPSSAMATANGTTGGTPLRSEMWSPARMLTPPHRALGMTSWPPGFIPTGGAVSGPPGLAPSGGSGGGTPRYMMAARTGALPFYPPVTFGDGPGRLPECHIWLTATPAANRRPGLISTSMPAANGLPNEHSNGLPNGINTGEASFPSSSSSDYTSR